MNVEAGVTYDVGQDQSVHSGSFSICYSLHIAGKRTTAPSSVSDFTLDYLGTNALLTWTPVTDQRFKPLCNPPPRGH